MRFVVISNCLYSRRRFVTHEKILQIFYEQSDILCCSLMCSYVIHNIASFLIKPAELTYII